ncbi:MAG: DUF4878 domain-containing protein [Desulfuromonadales bacterium]
MKLPYVVVLMLFTLLIGCSGEQDKVVIGYCKALESGKLDEAASFLSRDAKIMLEKAGGKSLLAEAGLGFKQRKGIDEIKITQKKVTGGSAIVDLVYKFKDGSTVGDNFPLVKENGSWKITR